MKNIDSQMGFNPFKQGNPFDSHNRHHKAKQNDAISPTNMDRNRLQREQLSLDKNTTVGMSVVYKSISHQFSSTSHSFSSSSLTMSVSTMNEESSVEEEEKSFFDFAKVAETVLSFVNMGLQALQQRGASTAELEEKIGQARLGANQGIDAAIVELDELNLLDEKLQEGIETSRDLISTGINDLETKFLPKNNGDVTSSDDKIKPFIDPVETVPASSANSAEKSSSGVSNTTPEVSVFGSATQTAPVSHTLDYTNDSYRSSSKTSDLSITTADGDIVTISFSDFRERQRGESFSYAASEDSLQASYQLNSASYRETNFSYSVEGELDDEERAAIGDLIKDINKIEKAFFNGNIEKAYEKALKLGFDDEQLSSFSLDLTLTTTSYVSQAYNEVANYVDDNARELAKQTIPILDFVEQFKQLREAADELLNQDKQQFSKLLELVHKAEYGNDLELLKRFTNFTDKLA